MNAGRNRSLVSVAALIVASLVIGNIIIRNLRSSSSPSPAYTTSAPGANAVSSSVPVGRPLELTGNGTTAIVTLRTVSYRPRGVGPLAKPPLNGEYAIADISIRVTEGSYSYDATDFRYQASDGRTYVFSDGNGDLAGFEPSITIGALGVGQSTRGYLTFDVPQGRARDIQLTDALGEVLGEWTA